MKILAIETSCDDTGIAILEIKKTGGFNVLSNIVSSQIEVHKKYGGVYPAMAKREHQKNLVPTLIEALKKAQMLETNVSVNFAVAKNTELNEILSREPELLKKIIPFLKKYKKPNIDLISVTNGPGLEPCLWVGVNFAKALSSFWNIPVVPTNHIESHVLVNLLENPPSHKATARQVKFPAIALVVSGGHTQIILMKKIGKYKILGETRDDAAGECFDKCAKILGLGYPGGPIIAALAAKFEIRNPKSETNSKFQIGPYEELRQSNFKLPRPMMGSGDYDFSFSGLKTAVLYSWQKIQKNQKNKNSDFLATWQKTFATEIQQAIIDVLIKKTIKAAKDYKAKTLILGGGVSANQELRKQFLTRIQGLGFRVEFLVPPANLSTDNAVMTAITGYFHRNKKIVKSDVTKLFADGNLRIK